MKNLKVFALSMMTLAPASLCAGQADNSLVWGYDTQLESMNPYATNKGKAQLVMRNVLEHLLYRSADGQAKPALATSWTWVDATTIDFTLREGVTFHNGEAFDADDVVYTVAQIKNPDAKISAQGDYKFIDSVEKTGQYSIRMKLSKPTPSAIDRLSQTLFILPNETYEAMDAAEFGRAPVGTGPYKVIGFEAGQMVELARNESYYDAEWGQPQFDKLTVLTLPDPQTRLAELTSGRVDFVWGLSPDDMMQLTMSADIETVTGDSTTVTFLSLDPNARTGENPTQDKNVRLAMIHAIDRAVVGQVMQGAASIALDTSCHPKQFGCTQDVVGYQYNVEKAKEYMAASAYPDGFELKIAAFTENARIAEAVTGYLREIGIEATVDQRETTAWVKGYFAGEIPVGIVPWPSNGVYDVSSITPFFFEEGQGDYIGDAEINAWFAEAGSIIDEEERLRLYALGFGKMADEVLNIPMVTKVTNYAYRSGLDFTPAADGYPLIYMAGWK